MPYIKKERRAGLTAKIDELALEIERLSMVEGNDVPQVQPGDINFAISKLIHYIYTFGGTNYASINEAIGVLECAKMELYRRVAAPYEDKKIKENGDVF